MSSNKSEQRRHAVAKRIAKLRRDGVPVRQVAEACEVHKGQVLTLQKLGERLLSLESES